MTITYHKNDGAPLANGKVFFFKADKLKEPEGLVATFNLNENGTTAAIPQEMLFAGYIPVTSEHYAG